MIEPKFDKSGGLVPAIVQDAETKEVLMMAYMNRESWEATLLTGRLPSGAVRVRNCGSKAKVPEMSRS